MRIHCLRGESLRFLAAQTLAMVHGFDAFLGTRAPGPAWTGGHSRPGVGFPRSIQRHPSRGGVRRDRARVGSDVGPRAIVIAHIDSDLYGSTVSVLRRIKPYFVPGTVLIRDELLDVFHNDEHRALVEELLETSARVAWIGFYLYPRWGLAACPQGLPRSGRGGRGQRRTSREDSSRARRVRRGPLLCAWPASDRAWPRAGAVSRAPIPAFTARADATSRSLRSPSGCET